ncbi:MFS general substrate transporter [Pseudovirgaria hyperparasitica]|uniref:MFS general substrate transporter n=1 Tax=Pseudovirgaria hyperparasitica TaxID=470096 RepID=A0A6A6W4S0_9PEZI|nr:MFS general substrate transporter [Pseudovirgaria hyperparasitica]KAF2756557.1 MFS general substrate transporter [Pseudovirgaria hyperparasitica]
MPAMHATGQDKAKDAVETIENTNLETHAARPQHVDKAAALLATEERIYVSPEDNKRVLRKIDLALLPLLLTIYFLQSLDKTSLSYASVFGLLDDANLVGDQYSWLGSIVYVAQLVFQPIISFLLVKLPIGKFISVMVLTWAIVLCGMVGATNFGGLLATRFLLGAAEAAVAPAFIAVVQMWYRRHEQTNRNASWYAMLGVVNILGSLLSYGLGHIDSRRLHSYQIIFLFCGLLTFVVSIFCFIFMPDSPMEARFLTHDEKVIAVERLRMNQMGVASRVWKWEHVKECILDPKTWLWFSMLTAVSIPSGGITTFGPLIVKSFGFDSFTTILFNMPFGAVQIISTLGGAWAATKLKKKSPVLIILCIPPIVGILMLMFLEHTQANQAPLLVGYYLISVYPGISPLIYSWSGQNTGGDTKRKVNTGILFVGASAGNIIGPHLFTPAEAPRYARGLRVNLALFIVIMLVVVAAAAWIRILNRKHANMRLVAGKNAIVVDYSMETGRTIGNKAGVMNGDSGGGIGDKAFDDMTDLVNEDFIYLY